MVKIDLNCDLGESYGDRIVGNDAEIIPYVSSCNIACGFHGGDPLVIENTIKLAIKYGVSIGAHPSFPDMEGFGRRYMKMSDAELRACLLYQIGALKSMTEALGGTLKHVKPHGALYNAAAKDFQLAKIIGESIKTIDDKLVFVGMANSEMKNAAKEVGLQFMNEVFADRVYTEEGFLVSREQKHAVLHESEQVLQQSLQMVLKNQIVTENNSVIPVQADTICVHGDNMAAVKLVKYLREHFDREDIQISAFR